MMIESSNITKYTCALALMLGTTLGCSSGGSSIAQESTSGIAKTSQAVLVSGTKKVLVIRTQFKPSGDPEDGSPASASDTAVAQSMVDLDNFYNANSYGQLRFAPIGQGSVLTPLYTLPKTKAENDREFTIYADSLALAKQGGFDPDDTTLYDLVVLTYGNNTCGAQTDPNGRNIWIRGCGTEPFVLLHEFRHNALLHAGDPGWVEAYSWQPSASAPYDPIDPNGTPLANGDQTDVGGNWASDPSVAHLLTRHLSAYSKAYAGWILPSQVAGAPSGQDNIQTVRIYATDDAAPTSGYRAFALPRNLFGRTDLEQVYWGEYRTQWPQVASINNGIVLHWAPFSKCIASTLLDMRPGRVDPLGIDDREDVGLFVGKTFWDPSANIAITPMTINDTTPKSIDVVIATGAFPDNHNPSGRVTSPGQDYPITTVGQPLTFNANGTDPDGDPLAYYWEFGDNVDATQNSPTVNHAWTSRGTYTVSVQISDRKGNYALAMQQVDVRAAPPAAPPANFTATAVSPNQINLSWTIVSDAATYSLERSVSGGAFTKVASLVSSLDNYPDLNLTPKTGYQYRIQACSVDNTCSAYSNVVSATTPGNGPTVNITAPANNATYTAPATITINASASEVGGTISKVEFYRGTTLLGTDTTSPYSYNWSNVAAGSYTLTAKAYDSSNVSATSSPVTVTVNAGSNPCAGLCSNPTVFTTTRYQSGSLGTGTVCRETKANLTGGNCSEMYGRTLKVNGTAMNCIGWTLPSKRNDGYCIQVTAGTPDWASFATW